MAGRGALMFDMNQYNFTIADQVALAQNKKPSRTVAQIATLTGRPHHEIEKHFNQALFDKFAVKSD